MAKAEKDDKAQDFMVVRDFWHGPTLHRKGEVISLTPAQAKYRGSEIEPVPGTDAAKGEAEKPAKATTSKGAVS